MNIHALALHLILLSKWDQYIVSAVVLLIKAAAVIISN